MRSPVLISCVAIVSLLLALSGCAASGPPTTVPISAPQQWFGPLPAVESGMVDLATTQSPVSSLPHNGSLTVLSQWWQQHGDALLVELIEAAQGVSPSVITARSNIEQARATRVGSEAALLPTLDATANLSRSVSTPVNRAVVPPSNLGQIGLQASWELDLFGQNQASLAADEQRLSGTEALWHDARVSVAAEVARQYYTLRSCEKLLLVAQADTRSREQTSRLTALLVKAGFEAPANAALASASAAESNSRAIQQRADCEVDIKTLVALTALAEPVLRQKLAQVTASAAGPGIANISSVPAQVLAQRPDVFNAARELTAVSFEVGSARAQRYPRLSLTGAVTSGRIVTRGSTTRFETWSVGPLALTLPLFDGGASEARLDAAKARYEEAAGKYRSICRQAVREVEEALVRLQSTTDRASDAFAAENGYRSFYKAAEARYNAGLASLVELEDSRRTLLAAQTALLNLELERRSAWITLYRALGGGWTTAAPNATPMVFDIPESALPFWN